MNPDITCTGLVDGACIGSACLKRLAQLASVGIVRHRSCEPTAIEGRFRVEHMLPSRRVVVSFWCRERENESTFLATWNQPGVPFTSWTSNPVADCGTQFLEGVVPASAAHD